MSQEKEYICKDCQPRRDDKRLVRKCHDCGCEFCNHSVPKLGVAVIPACVKCFSTNISF